ncbi:MAG TPA: tetratricopeptide repeat protein [Candidatus Eisenbacteria bacterium]|nr:tetratricopeptide repeat protein [Candidatus Eisenbacteria bacterium]
MFGLGPRRIAQCLLLVAPTLCAAQGSMPSRVTSVQILVRVTVANDRSAGDQIRVQLTSETGVPVADAFTDSEGRVTFNVQGTGTFEVRASGIHLQGTAVERVLVGDMDKSRTVYVRATPRMDATVSSVKSNAPPVTSAAELRIPAGARKAFRKGMDAWERNDFYKAAEQFEKAVAIYPQYDTAYNNLGVMYYQTGQAEKARAAFEKSVALNDKNADADRNLARMLVHDGNYARAQELLKKSLIVEPLNPVTLTLLCVVQVQTGDYDGALMTARKVHQLPHEGYALVHDIAGQAYEHKGEPQNAAIEYETYLRETPNGPEANQVRTSLARLTAARQSSSH